MGTHDQEFYCLTSPLSISVSEGAKSVYGNPDWYEMYESPDLEGEVSFQESQCPLFPERHRTRSKHVEDLRLVMATPLIGDFTWVTFPGAIVVTDRVVELFRKEGITGFNTRPASIMRVRGRRKDAGPIPKVWELEVNGKGGNANPQAGIRLLYSCPGCSFVQYSSYRNGIVVDKGQWDGTDFFSVNGYPQYTMITELVKQVITGNQLTNCAIVRSRDMVWWNMLDRPEDHPDRFIPGRATKSPEYLLGRCKEVLSGMGGPTGLFVEPREYFEFFWSLGQLTNGVWSHDLNKGQIDEVNSKSREIVRRLTDILGYRREQVLVGLGNGVKRVLDEAGRWLEAAKDGMNAGTTKQAKSALFDIYVLETRDQLGYALHVLEKANVSLGPDLLSRIRDFDRRLKELLPMARERFKNDVVIGSELFPSSFWWRRKE